MKIGDLNMHCGNCDVIIYCGGNYGKAICCDSRFENIEEKTYIKIADEIIDTGIFERCRGCEDYDSDICYTCDYVDEAADFRAEQVADYVYEQLARGGTK